MPDPAAATDRRVDGRDKVTGRADYVGDLLPDGCLHAALRQSPVARGRIVAIDSAAAEAVAGVRLVLTHANALRLRPAAVLLGAQGHKASAAESLLPLQDTRLHHAGQPVALVVADDPALAAHAASLLKVRCEAASPLTDLDDPSVEAVEPVNGWDRPAEGGRGDFAAAWAAARAAGEAHLDQTYTTAMQHHAALEPHATLAAWEGDRLTVHEPTTWTHGARRTLAAWFGLREEQVRVLHPFVGGSFGGKGPLWPHVAATAMAARLVGRPVRLVLERRQVFGSAGHRPRIRHRVRLAATPDGRLTALGHDALSHSSVHDRRVVAPVTKATRRLYACPNLATSYRLKQLNLGGPFTMRGPGEAPGSFAVESALDELAYALGMDPVALRLANDPDADPDTGEPWSSRHLRRCLEEGAAGFGWHARDPRPRAMRDGRDLLGWGVAGMMYDAHSLPTAARAAVDADGDLLVQSATCEQGTGSRTVYRRVAADTLGWPVERTRFELGDSDLPFAPISAGSMTAASVGSAVQAVCRTLRRRLAALACADPASPLHGHDPEAVALAEGVLRTAGNAGEAATVLLRRQGRDRLAVEEKAESDRFGEGYSRMSFGAHFVEVRVDEALGAVRVSRHLGRFAAGRILNPVLARSQLLGGVVFGLGMALHEQSEPDTRLGRIANATLADYLVPVNADIGAIDVAFVPERDAAVNALGVKGIGEIGTVGTAAAIANAVFHATGRRVRDLPILPEKLLA